MNVPYVLNFKKISEISSNFSGLLKIFELLHWAKDSKMKKTEKYYMISKNLILDFVLKLQIYKMQIGSTS